MADCFFPMSLESSETMMDDVPGLLLADCFFSISLESSKVMMDDIPGLLLADCFFSILFLFHVTGVIRSSVWAVHHYPPENDGMGEK